MVGLYSLPDGTQPTCGKESRSEPAAAILSRVRRLHRLCGECAASPNCLPLSLAAYPNAVAFDAVKGQMYRIAVDGNMGTTGNLPLCLAVTSRRE